MARKAYTSCTIKQLPDKDKHAAALHAISCNPVNRVPVEKLAAIGFEPELQHIAVMTTKFWGAGGVHLTVGFLSNASAALQEKILAHMNAWGKYCNASFTITGGAAANAGVRISLAGQGYWSYLGTDVGRIQRGQPTMNLQGFSLSTPDSEFYRVVRHETGHTLGCPHEHMRKELVDRLDRAKTIAYFQRTQGWSPQEIEQQVLTPLSESSLMGATPHAEDDSIMCYALPASITTDGRPIPGGKDITADDGLYLGKIYPLEILPPLPPPPPPGDSLTVNVSVAGYKAGSLQLQKV